MKKSSESGGATDGDTDTAPTPTLIATPLHSSDDGEVNLLTGVTADTTSIPFVVKRPHANSKLILQNMEEVLNSVKKKHRQKHRRKREQKKLAAQMAEAEREAAVTAIVDVADTQMLTRHVEVLVSKHAKGLNKHNKRTVPERGSSVAQENGLSAAKGGRARSGGERKSPLKGMSVVCASNTILKHFPRTPSKAIEDGTAPAANIDTAEPANGGSAELKREMVVVIDGDSPTRKKASKPTNAFEVMMNARNKSIGSNTPGKDAPVDVGANELPTSDVKVRRKLMLQEWADKRGGNKRRLEEDQRADYVEQQLEQRSKKFKRMLVNGTNASSPAIQESINSSNPGKDAQLNADSPAMKRGKGRPRGSRNSRPRLRSIHDDGVDALRPPALDAETAEFLSKLASPTKKRDSLLGFFPKTVSPKELQSVSVTTPKARGRRSAAAKLVATPAIIDRDVQSVEVETAKVVASDDTPSGRPKRSCAGKARYDYDLQGSPTKGAQPRPSDTTAAANRSDVIDLDDSNSTLSPEQKETPKRLAPLFTRAMPKPSFDPGLLKARQDFLMSGVPDKMRREQAKQKQFEQNFEEVAEFFPKVSHVQQLSVAELHATEIIGEASEGPGRIKLRPADEELGSQTVTESGGRRGKAKKRCPIGTWSACTGKEFRAMSTHPAGGNKAARSHGEYTPHAVLGNKCAVVKMWKAEFERFPTYKCFNQMREKYRYFSAIDAGPDAEQVSESFVVTRGTRRRQATAEATASEEEEARPPMAAPNGELLFTEKYRPLMLEQVLVNLNPVTRLREFLSSWACTTGSSGRNSQGLDDSLDFANDSNSSPAASCNSVVLLGPVASGKTNAVFALANEMNFNVLEINAGMKRTGKKLLQELQEATQSHQIRKESSGVGQTKVQKNLLKMSLNGLKSKKPSAQSLVETSSESSSTSSATAELSQSTRKCLILIEDADVVFEQTDAGFTEAVNQLAGSSKRPVIVMATKANCAHLQRLMQQNTICFAAPNSLNTSRFLSVLALMENCPIVYDDIISLYLYNGKDLRKTLLELQFFIQSGGDGNSHQRAVAHTTPPKKKQPPQTPQFFASPNKRRFSEDPNAPAALELDDQLAAASARSATGAATDAAYLHRTLFEFFTAAQNVPSRIPFPVDFRLLGVNLSELFQVAHKLQPDQSSPLPKRKAPKKPRLSSAAGGATVAASSLDALCSFYENLSVATLLGHAGDDDGRDRLTPHVTEQMAHELIERSIEVDLDAAPCPYNLFCTPPDSAIAIGEYLGTAALGSRRANALDYEPALRWICRSERWRSTQERRSTRFYHYLRNSAVNICNFSTKPFDAACAVLQARAEATEAAAVPMPASQLD